jgi:hypothetical protein
VLPVLLVALSIGRVVVTDASLGASGPPDAGRLPRVTLLGCRASRGARCAGRRRLTIRYLQGSLSDRPNVSRVLEELRRPWVDPDGVAPIGPRAPRRALLVKSAEWAFRGGEPVARAVQDALSAGLLAQADMLLQDTQSSVRWSAVEAWLAADGRPARFAPGVLPFGVYVGADEAFDALIRPSPALLASVAPTSEAPRAAGAAELLAEDAAMRALFGLRTRHRSLRGLRFGYCHSTRGLDPGLLARRIPLAEPPATGEEDTNEQSGQLYCSALLAWRHSARAMGTGPEPHTASSSERQAAGEGKTMMQWASAQAAVVARAVRARLG